LNDNKYERHVSCKIIQISKDFVRSKYVASDVTEKRGVSIRVISERIITFPIIPTIDGMTVVGWPKHGFYRFY